MLGFQLVKLVYPMAHNQNISLDSMGSLISLTSISSRASLETYESLEIKELEQSQVGLQALIDKAAKIINETRAQLQESLYI